MGDGRDGHYSPAELRALVAGVAVEILEVRPRVGVTREGVSFPMGHELLGRWDGAEVLVLIDPARDGRCQLHLAFRSDEPPTALCLQRRRPGVTGRGLRTGVRVFDEAFKLEVEPAAAVTRILDPALAGRLATDDEHLLDDAVGIRRGDRGLPGFGTCFRVAARPDAVAVGFALTRELRARLLASGPPG
jgi:hypothetical protein